MVTKTRRPPGSQFATNALHGPHSRLSREDQAARLRWLDDNAAKEQQLAELAEMGQCGYADRGRGPARGFRGFDDDTAARPMPGYQFEQWG